MEYTAEWQECYQKWGTALCGAVIFPWVMLVAAGIHWRVWEDGSPVLWVPGGKGKGYLLTPRRAEVNGRGGSGCGGGVWCLRHAARR
jgi:hypothetical protein